MNQSFDPRTKIICILLVVVCTAYIPSLAWENALIVFICIFGILNCVAPFAVKFGIFYFAVYGMWQWVMINAVTGSGVVATSAMAWLSLVFKLMPCCMISAIAIKTTKINEFLTAMSKSKVPKQVTIPLAVLLRYLPTVREDWGYIKDAMILRGVTPSLIGFLKNPATTVECLYVPLLITASGCADEISLAAVTRGIENPNKRTSIAILKLRVTDYLAIGAFAIMTALIVSIGVIAQ